MFYKRNVLRDNTYSPEVSYSTPHILDLNCQTPTITKVYGAVENNSLIYVVFPCNDSFSKKRFTALNLGTILETQRIRVSEYKYLIRNKHIRKPL